MNMSSLMSAKICLLTLERAFMGSVSRSSSLRSALRHIAMSRPAATPFPATSAMTMAVSPFSAGPSGM